MTIAPANATEKIETIAIDVTDATTAMTDVLGLLHLGALTTMTVVRGPLPHGEREEEEEEEEEKLQGMIPTDGGMVKTVEDLTILIEGATKKGTPMGTTVRNVF